MHAFMHIYIYLCICLCNHLEVDATWVRKEYTRVLPMIRFYLLQDGSVCTHIYIYTYMYVRVFICIRAAEALWR